MLDDTMRQFATEMEARKPLRPSGTPRGVEVDNLNGIGAARLGKETKSFWSAAGFGIQAAR
jgi:hypothetical protein